MRPDEIEQVLSDLTCSVWQEKLRVKVVLFYFTEDAHRSNDKIIK